MTTTEPQPLTPSTIQNADSRLDAYLQARIRDYNTHGWGDDGVIETRDGRALMTTHIDITLRRARAAETARDQALAENAQLRRHAADDERYIRSLQAVLERVRQIAGSSGDGLDARAALREALNTPLPESVTGPLPIPVFPAAVQAATGGPTAAPTPPAQSNSSSPAQSPPVTAWDQFCGATNEPGASATTAPREAPKPCSRRPFHDGPHGNADGVWWPAAAVAEPDLRPYDLSDLTPEKLPGAMPSRLSFTDAHFNPRLLGWAPQVKASPPEPAYGGVHVVPPVLSWPEPKRRARPWRRPPWIPNPVPREDLVLIVAMALILIVAAALLVTF